MWALFLLVRASFYLSGLLSYVHPGFLLDPSPLDRGTKEQKKTPLYNWFREVTFFTSPAKKPTSINLGEILLYGDKI